MGLVSEHTLDMINLKITNAMTSTLQLFCVHLIISNAHHITKWINSIKNKTFNTNDLYSFVLKCLFLKALEFRKTLVLSTMIPKLCLLLIPYFMPRGKALAERKFLNWQDSYLSSTTFSLHGFSLYIDEAWQFLHGYSKHKFRKPLKGIFMGYNLDTKFSDITLSLITSETVSDRRQDKETL